MKEYISWTAQYETGIPEIDEQHQGLFAIINRLMGAIDDGDDSDKETNSTIGELVYYMLTHFAEEEAFLEQYNVPNREAHKNDHKFFIGKVEDFQQGVLEGKQKVSNEVLEFLVNWLTDHILGQDMKYVKYFNDQGVILTEIC